MWKYYKNPANAKQLGIDDGEMVRVSSPQSSIDVRARVVESFVPGVVGFNDGWWDPVSHFLTPVMNIVTLSVGPLQPTASW